MRHVTHPDNSTFQKKKTETPSQYGWIEKDFKCASFVVPTSQRAPLRTTAYRCMCQARPGTELRRSLQRAGSAHGVVGHTNHNHSHGQRKEPKFQVSYSRGRPNGSNCVRATRHETSWSCLKIPFTWCCDRRRDHYLIQYAAQVRVVCSWASSRSGGR